MAIDSARQFTEKGNLGEKIRFTPNPMMNFEAMILEFLGEAFVADDLSGCQNHSHSTYNNAADSADSHPMLSGLVLSQDTNTVHSDEFVGIVDFIHMRAVIWPDRHYEAAVPENCVPTIVPLWDDTTQDHHQHKLLYPNCPVTQAAVAGRFELMEAIAEVDETIEEMYLNELEPSNADLRLAVRRATLRHRALPVMAASAVHGKGVEPCLDVIADFLPWPIDRMPPALTKLRYAMEYERRGISCEQQEQQQLPAPDTTTGKAALGHCFNPSLLALAFKVVHMKGRGGSGWENCHKILVMNEWVECWKWPVAVLTIWNMR